jgi:hypothetical protein
MGRIGWAEALALKQTNDIQTFNNLILDPFIGELLTHTWLYERYDCNSVPTHNPFYVEYPELVVLTLREITYGINIGLNAVLIEPTCGYSFMYHIGMVSVDYSKERVSVSAPGSGSKRYFISGMISNATYMLSITKNGFVIRSNEDVISDAHGILRFTAPLGVDHVVTVQHYK